MENTKSIADELQKMVADVDMVISEARKHDIREVEEKGALLKYHLLQAIAQLGVC